MKKFFLLLITLSVLPFSMLRSDPSWTQITVAAVAVGVVGRACYSYYTSPNPSVETQTPNTSTDNQNPKDPADEDTDKDKDRSDKKDHDEDKDPKKDKDRIADESINKMNEHTKKLLEDLNKKPSSNPCPFILEPVDSHNKNILYEPTILKPTEVILNRERTFMEKWLAYSADYKRLHEENRDCFEN